MSDTQDKVVQTQVDVQVIKAGQIETNRRLQNIEIKMDGFSFVKLADYEIDKKNFMTKDEFKPYKWFFYTVGLAIITSIVGFAIAFVVKGGLK